MGHVGGYDQQFSRPNYLTTLAIAVLDTALRSDNVQFFLDCSVLEAFSLSRFLVSHF